MPVALSLLLASVPVPPAVDRPLLAWTPGEIRCGERTVAMTVPRRPALALVWPNLIAKPLTLRFSIDAGGRAIDVTSEADENVPSGEDVAPALVASRFAAGAPQTACRVTYQARLLPIAQAPLGDLMSYSIDRRYGDLPRTGWDRITPPGDCTREPRPMPLTRVMPDFARLPGTPGAREWSMVGYDTDAKGKPVNVRIIAGTRNAALDRASTAAMRASRFTQGARTGCLYPFWRGAVVLPAPEPARGEEAKRPTGGNCPDPHGWATPPTLTFPEPWRRRMIEGWALLAYDVAPWGEIGNVRVLAAQPAADFGRHAIGVLRGARLPSSPTGFTGCVDRVRFVMGTPGDPRIVPAPGEVPRHPF